MIHTVKGFYVVNEAEVDVLLELSCFFSDPADVGNLISGSSAFSKSLNIWKFMVHVLLKPGLENFEHYFASMWDECSCTIVWTYWCFQRPIWLYISGLSSSRWVITPSWLSGSLISFLCSYSMYSFNLFLIYSASVRSVPFLSFIVPMFAWNIPSLSLIFLKTSLVFPILLFASISLHCHLGRLSYLSLLVFETHTQIGVSFLFSFAFHFFSFLAYL